MNKNAAMPIFPFMELSIEDPDLNFSARIINNCKILGAKTIGDLLKKKDEQESVFLNIFGEKSRLELEEKLAAYALVKAQ